MSLLTVVVPCYNEEEAIPFFYEEMLKTIEVFNKDFPSVEFEMLFIDDGSKDKTLKVLREYNERDKRVRYVSFSRNFGKEAGIYAGLDNAKGDYVVIMDADLQDPPSLLPEMFKAVTEEGFDSAATRRVTRKGEPVIRSFFARMFYKLMARISKTEIVDGARDYRIMTRQMVDAILSMGEYNRFTKGIYGWVGFETKWFEYENVERVAGETKWSFWKLFMYSIEGVIGFSTAPLVISSFFGILCMLLAFVMIVFIIIRKLIYGDPTSGWPSLVCIIMLIGGMQLSCIGIVGEYLAKTYLETKHRPIYIAKEIR
ncbi:MAG: glycosyltransferase family 2 protein [Lachnospiraceae bacterium]|nr:glycosyltransferase family 2 protein [Lachnospiraceae bacterium]MCI6978905.1 glycosyltransferase family 2 protein [Lachnospiraceae bacterium]MDY3255345.1 glycosyltransferase family 2 protein [Lachnospiraceae bacterium]MDY5640663.1 glycosyltransferase family 2 protein [Lachnospiraceae bacterium]